MSVITAVKRVQMEVRNCFRIPDSQCIDYMISVSDNRHIIRYSKNRAVVFLNEIVPFRHRVVFDSYISSETDFFCVLITANLKRVAVLEPVVRYFHLISVLDFLLEHAVTVTDSAAVGRIPQCRKGIKKAGRKSSETTISKSRIRFLILYRIQIDSHLIQRFFDFFISSHIDQVVAQSSSHQELHGHVIYCLWIFFFHFCLRRKPVINDRLFYGKGNCLKDLPSGCFFDCFSIKVFNIILYFLFKSFFLKSFTVHLAFPS